MKAGVTLLLLLSALGGYSQSICSEARALMNQTHARHIQPRRLDDAFSAAVFTEFFKTLDPGRQLFSSKDTASLSVYKTQLDKDGTKACDFVDRAVDLYRARALRYSHLVDSLLSKPFDFSVNESIASSIGRWTIAKTRGELDNNISKELKFEILKSMYRQAAVSPDNLSTAGAFLKFEPPARQRVRKNALLEVTRRLSDDNKLRSFVEDSFLKAIPKAFDPHSAYFGKADQQSFFEYLNTSKLSFGIKFSVSQIEEVVVSELVPGGPAWGSGKIKKGDVLIGLKWEGSGEFIDLIDVDINTIYNLFQKGDEDTAVFSVRTPDGTVNEVQLVKARLENEDNMVITFVLTEKSSTRKVGYLALPGFFTSDDGSYENCAQVMTRELIKLKGEGIEGLIFDLRFNGGGLLSEAIELAGLFINHGPVAITETYTGRTVTKEILVDSHRGQVYDGPLVIMVNGASASASEIVAGTLQDYGRAVIVGTPTYGKATGQIVRPFRDEFLKVTDMRVYRLSGRPHQLEGVIPDFTIPDLSELQFLRETDYARALTPMPTTRKVNYKRLSSAFDGAPAYAKRNTLSKDFDTLEKLRVAMKGNIPLEVHAFIAAMQNVRQWEHDLWSDPNKHNEIYQVSNCQYDTQVLQGDLYHSEMNKIQLHQIVASIYIPEAFKLLDYMIGQKK